jgi:hypothetical protein
MVQISGGSSLSLSISHAIAVAPTCAQGSAISRARISSTTRSVSSGVFRAWVFGARERSWAQLPSPGS